ncbi:unnamed protein product [Prorocentrum cordatum]|uniref:Uncharacterized protein n=1 Tax=Prorocentrum cordatum TaxID=2364126 RepID=A0ABN9V811_9DINO|nr:unnamed protein product [Polarella glacialis]
MTPGSMKVDAVNSFERLVNIFCLVCGVMVFSSLISLLSAKLTHNIMLKQAVPLAKITDAHEEGKVKLVLSFTSGLNFAPVLASLVQAGAEYKQGTAPMGHLERLLHTGLQEFESMMQE